jgi:hypothetical protein
MNPEYSVQNVSVLYNTRGILAKANVASQSKSKNKNTPAQTFNQQYNTEFRVIR